MKRNLLGLILLLAALGLASGCAEVVKAGTSVASATGYLSGSQKSAIDNVADKTDKAARPITDSEEYYIGRAVAARILGKYRLYDNEPATTYINEIGMAVALASDRPRTAGGYHFAILDTTEINAFACPGGMILVTRGMLQKAQNEDEVASILAHEVAHVNNKDGIASISQARWTEVATAIGTGAAKSFTGADIGGLISMFEGAIDDIFKTLVVNGYSRDQEFKADQGSLRYTQKVGYNPASLTDFLGKMGDSSSGGIMSTHPASADRLKEAKGETDKIGALAAESSAQKARNERFKTLKF
jgi:predicted Zn-dependent protease